MTGERPFVLGFRFFRGRAGLAGHVSSGGLKWDESAVDVSRFAVFSMPLPAGQFYARVRGSWDRSHDSTQSTGPIMSLDTYLAGTFMVVGSAAVAVLGLFMIRRHFNVRDLVAAHEISGQYLSIVGTMYAVLLGLIVVDAMSRFQQAITIVEKEANSLSELIYLSGGMPEAQRARAKNGR